MAYSFQLDPSEKFNRYSEVFNIFKNNAHVFDLVVGYVKDVDKYYICAKAYSHRPCLKTEFGIVCDETLRLLRDFINIKDGISSVIQDISCTIEPMTLDNLLIYINNDFLDDVFPLEFETATVFNESVLLWLEERGYLELTALDNIDDHGDILYEELTYETTIPDYYQSYIEAPAGYYLSLNKEEILEKMINLKED